MRVASHNGIDNRQTGDPSDIADDVMDLKVHLVQRLLHVLHVDAGHLNEVFTMPHQGTNFTDGLFGAKVCLQYADRVQVLKPLAIQNIGFTSGNMVDMLSVDQMHFNAPSLQDLKQRNPVNPSRFHRHGVHVALLQPIRQLMQVFCKSRKRSYRFGIAIGWDCNKDLCRSDINTTGIRSHHRQTPIQVAMFSSLLCHGSPPYMKYGNEPGVQKIEISQAGSAQQNACCLSPMLLRTGLGSNSLTGSLKQAPMGKRPTLTIAVRQFLNNLMPRTGPASMRSSSLLLIWPRTSWHYSLAKEGWTRPQENIAKPPLW